MRVREKILESYFLTFFENKIPQILFQPSWRKIQQRTPQSFSLNVVIISLPIRTLQFGEHMVYPIAKGILKERKL